MTFQEITHPDDLDADLAQVDGLIAGEIDSYEMEKRYFTKDGHLIWVLLAVAMVREEDGAPRHFISQVQDISARKRLEAHTYELANRDPITSLYNRRRFEEELKRQIARCRDEDESAALLLLDLDRFKNVNDSDGHVAGDRLIRLVGRALDERIAEPDVAARIGGDEFAVILRDIDLAQARGGRRRAAAGGRRAPTPSAPAPPASASAGCTATCPTPRPASAPSTGRCTGRRARAATGWSSARSPSAGRRGRARRRPGRVPAGPVGCGASSARAGRL